MEFLLTAFLITISWSATKSEQKLQPIFKLFLWQNLPLLLSLVSLLCLFHSFCKKKIWCSLKNLKEQNSSANECKYKETILVRYTVSTATGLNLNKVTGLLTSRILKQLLIWVDKTTCGKTSTGSLPRVRKYIHKVFLKIILTNL